MVTCLVHGVINLMASTTDGDMLVLGARLTFH